MRILAISFAFMLLPLVAAAQEDAMTITVRQHDATARYHFEAERYDDALVSLLAAQQLLPAVPRLYSIATCYDRLGQAVHAIAYYDRFVVEVRAGGLRSGGRDQRAAIRSRFLRSHPIVDESHISVAGEDVAPEQPPVVIPENTRPLQLTMPTPLPSRISTTLRYSFITLASTAAVFATISGIFTGVAYALDPQPDNKMTTQARSLLTYSYIGWGVVAGAAISAVILYLVYRFRNDSTSIWLSQTAFAGGRL
jgi:hypothetical protein